MRPFTHCKGKTACRDDGEQCLACGRSFAENTRTRQLIDELACAQGYNTVDAFVATIARKVKLAGEFLRFVSGHDT